MANGGSKCLSPPRPHSSIQAKTLKKPPPLSPFYVMSSDNPVSDDPVSEFCTSAEEVSRLEGSIELRRGVMGMNRATCQLLRDTKKAVTALNQSLTDRIRILTEECRQYKTQMTEHRAQLSAQKKRRTALHSSMEKALVGRKRPRSEITTFDEFANSVRKSRKTANRQTPGAQSREEEEAKKKKKKTKTTQALRKKTPRRRKKKKRTVVISSGEDN